MPQGYNSSFDSGIPVGHQSTRDFVTPQQKSNLLGKTFMYFGIGLLITLVFTIGVSLLFTNVFPIIDKTDVVNNTNATAYLVTMIASAIVVLILSIVLNFAFLGKKSKHKVFLTPFIIYSAAMGVLLSSFTLFIEWYVLAIALGITVVSFGVMALIGLTIKKGINIIAMVAMSLGISLLLLGGFWIFIYILFPAVFEWLYVGISAAYLVFMYLITIVDIYRIKKASDAGEQSNNLALFFAYRLYVDFVYILIRVLRIVLWIVGKSRR